VASPWVALPAGADARAVARRVHAAREGFLSTGQVDDVLRRLVVESWRRCIERGTDTRGGQPADWSDTELEEYRSRHPLAAAMPVVRRLLVEDATDAGFIVALTDAAGRLLWVEGAPRSRQQAEKIGFVEGATWSEDVAGTNAPGTSLALDQPVQIFASEHLADPVTPWSCSAAPIHAPDGTLLGAIDLTGGNEVAAPHNLTLVRTAAAAIEAELRVRQLHTPTSKRTTRARLGVVRSGRRDSVTRSRAARLRLLGHATGELITEQGTLPLRLRHAEILLLLTLNPNGLTAEQLAIELHDRTTAPVTLRAELSRLRELLARQGAVELGSRPYRLIDELGSDLAEVRRLLNRGAYRRALAAYPGPLLPDSLAPGVAAARDRLRRELRACLMAGGDPDLLWTYAQTAEGVDDLEIWEACRRALPATSRRAPVVAERVRQLNDDLG
jgi:transcriptional regulator of acetoin/glycerol metabolism